MSKLFEYIRQSKAETLFFMTHAGVKSISMFLRTTSSFVNGYIYILQNID